MEPVSGSPEPSASTDFLLMRYVFKRHRLTLLACTLAGMAAGFLYFKTAPREYLVQATLLVREENRNTELKNMFRQLNVPKKNSDIEDQIGLLKSFHIHLLALQEFRWRYRWSEGGWPTDRDLYPEEPFAVRITPDTSPLTDIPLRITVASPSSVRIECTDLAPGNPAGKKLAYDQVIPFGEPFRNTHFDFLLTPQPGRHLKTGDTFVLVFQDLEDQANRYKETLEAVRFNPLVESNLIRLKLPTDNPGRDVPYVNQLMRSYLEYGVAEKNRSAERAVRFIESQISGVNKSLESAGQNFTRFRSSNRTVNLDAEANALIEKQNQTESEWIRLSARIGNYRNLSDHLARQSDDDRPISPALTDFDDKALRPKVDKLNDLLARRQALALTVREQSPVLRALTDEIRFTRRMLMENLQSLLEQAEAETEALRSREKEIKQAISRIPVTENNMVGMKRNFNLNNELYTFLLERRAEAEITQASSEPNAQILDPASVSTAALLGPLLPLNITIGILAGFLAGVMIIVIRFFASDKIEEADEAYATLTVAPAGEIAHSRFNPDRTEWLDYPRSALAESFRGLRMNLSALLDGSNGKVIAIHGFLPGTGKSFVARHLAMAFSQQKKKVLLIDADLQRPVLHKFFPVSSRFSLNDYFRSDKPLAEMVSRTEDPFIDFIGASSATGERPVIPDLKKTRDMLTAFRATYDAIIIDNSPYGLIHDSRIFGAAADINLFIVRLGHSVRSELRELNRMGNGGLLPGLTVALNGKTVHDRYGYYQEPARAGFRKWSDAWRTDLKTMRLPWKLRPQVSRSAVAGKK